MGRPRSSRVFSRHTMWLIPFAILTLLPIIAMKTLVFGKFAQMEDNLSDVQEVLLESQERASDLEKALKKEQAQRGLVEEELSNVRREKEEHHRQIVKQMHAIGQLKASSQAELSAAQEKIKALQELLDASMAKISHYKTELEGQKSHESRVVNTKSEQLGAFAGHKLRISPEISLGTDRFRSC